MEAVFLLVLLATVCTVGIVIVFAVKPPQGYPGGILRWVTEWSKADMLFALCSLPVLYALWWLLTNF